MDFSAKCMLGTPSTPLRKYPTKMPAHQRATISLKMHGVGWTSTQARDLGNEQLQQVSSKFDTSSNSKDIALKPSANQIAASSLNMHGICNQPQAGNWGYYYRLLLKVSQKSVNSLKRYHSSALNKHGFWQTSSSDQELGIKASLQFLSKSLNSFKRDLMDTDAWQRTKQSVYMS